MAATSSSKAPIVSRPLSPTVGPRKSRRVDSVSGAGYGTGSAASSSRSSTYPYEPPRYQQGSSSRAAPRGDTTPAYYDSVSPWGARSADYADYHASRGSVGRTLPTGALLGPSWPPQPQGMSLPPPPRPPPAAYPPHAAVPVMAMPAIMQPFSQPPTLVPASQGSGHEAPWKAAPVAKA
eukprot:3719250-Heterocapsa_arctica.AAC.1